MRYRDSIVRLVVLACASILLLFPYFISECTAQQMWVEDFTRVKRPLWNRSKTTVDKQLALLDLHTPLKGFTFKSNGRDAAEADEGEGVITVKLPHKTQYVIMQHPDFGTYTWRVPGKYLKHKHRYQATLMAQDASHEYKLPWQWVVFRISPRNAVLYVDSALYLLRDGMKSLQLPLGTHTFRVESPFYEARIDSFVLTDTMKIQLNIGLQPTYSYLTVKTPWRNSRIHVDGQPVGAQDGTSFRLAEGSHRLSVYLGETCCYDAFLNIGRAEKKVVELEEGQYQGETFKGHSSTGKVQVPTPLMSEAAKASGKGQEARVGNQVVKDDGEVAAVLAPVTLKAADESTEIWVNREKVGTGQWIGLLDKGFYLITTQKGQLESAPTQLWITDDAPQEVNLAVPQTSQGMLNIYSNVQGADIYINKVRAGATPCIVRGLLPSREYDICLQKPGYKEASRTVRPRGNDVVDVYLKMKYIK